MFITPMDRLDAEFFENVSSSVKVIATNSVGLDHIDLEAAAARKIVIGYTPGANADATAEIAMLLMLGAARRAYGHPWNGKDWASGCPKGCGLRYEDSLC